MGIIHLRTGDVKPEIRANNDCPILGGKNYGGIERIP